MGYLHLACSGCQKAAHQQQWNSETKYLLPNKSAKTLSVVTAWYEIPGNEEIQSHEEGGIGREEMPYPRHHLRRIRRRICPLATVTIRLSRMMEYHQEGQYHLQIVKIIKSCHNICKYACFIVYQLFNKRRYLYQVTFRICHIAGSLSPWLCRRSEYWLRAHAYRTVKLLVNICKGGDIKG